MQPPFIAVAQLGCRTCEVTEQVPPESLRRQVLDFFDAHGGQGHHAWIDLAGGVIPLPRMDQPRSASS